MRLLFIGPQGSGKGTQAKIVSKKLGIEHISTGDLLRERPDIIKKYRVDKGNLVPDKVILGLLKDKIDGLDGFILDGYPRNIVQAKALDRITDIDKAIEIYISNEEAIKRLAYRLTCKGCKTVYNELINPPKKDNLCDLCGGELFKRADDTKEAIQNRLDIYHKTTESILLHYKSVRINGKQPIKKVTKDILDVLK